jgi:integrase
MSQKQKRTPGLIKRGEIWHINKRIRGQLLCESTGTADLKEAEKFLAFRLEQVRRVAIYGDPQPRTWRSLASRHYDDAPEARKKDLEKHFTFLDPWIGDEDISNVHMGTLADFIKYRQGKPISRPVPPGLPGKKAKPVSNRTVNHSLSIVRNVLNCAATVYRDERGQPYLFRVPKFVMLPLVGHQRAPRPITWDEQHKLFTVLPPHLHDMALFKVNTGTRDQEVCRLKWAYERPVPELGRSVFLIPVTDERGRLVKNGLPRLVVLNDIAWSVVNAQRGKHMESVFVYKGNPVERMNNTAWKRARRVSGVPTRVHDLKHTFGARLRAAGVTYEDRQTLLGHKSGQITTHYSAADIGELLKAANTVCQTGERAPTLLLVKSGTVLS